jgi:hypothetical protein
MVIKIFKAGDYVRLRKCILEEGVVLLESDDTNKKNWYYVIFCMGTSYEAKPWVQLVHADELSLIESEIHKPKEPGRFKK